jgi:CRISPR/Cas system-associated exonuclease Cas4 (RecB family)
MLAAYRDTFVLNEFNGKVSKFLEEIKPWLRQAVIDYEARQFQPIAAEEKVSFRYRKLEVTGRIDRIDTISSTKIKIIDYKTTKNPDYLTAMQLGVYHIGVKYGSLKEQYGNKDVETAYVLLRQDMREIPYVFREDELEGILTEVEEVVDLIGNDTTWEPKPSKLCQYCDFFVPCTQERGSCNFDFDVNAFEF